MMQIDDLETDNRAGRDDPDSRTASGGSNFDRVFDQVRENLRERRGLALVIGEAGAGKTPLLAKLKGELEAENGLVVLPKHPSTSFDELLKICCDAAGVADSVEDRLGRVHALTEILIERLQQGATAVVLIDDAQLLAVEVLEDFARLTTVEKDGQKLLQLVLAGRPELVAPICNCGYRPLQDSAIGHHRLESMAPPQAPAAANDDDTGEARETLDADAAETEDAAAQIAPEDIAPALTVSEDGAPEHDTTEDSAPEATAQVDTAEEDAAQIDTADQVDTAEEDVASEDTAPEDTAPEDTAPEDTAPEDGASEDAAPAEAEEHAALPAWMGPTEVASAEIPVEIPEPPARSEESPEPAAQGDEAAEPPSQADETPEAVDESADPREAAPAIAPILEGPVTTVTLTRPRRRSKKRAPIAAGLLVGLLLSGGALVWEGLWGSSEAPEEAKPVTEATATGAAGTETAAPAETAAQPREQRSGKPSTVRIARFRGVSGAVLQVMDARGKEDRALHLDVKVQLPAAIAGEALSVVISDMPDGALLLAGTDNGDGTWSVGAEQLANLTLIPPMDYSGRFQVMIMATLKRAGDTAVAVTLPLKVELVGVADLPGLEVADAATDGGGPVPLAIETALTDGDGSERLAITVSGLPEGARLTAGHELGDGRWRLGPDQLEALSLIPPPDFGGPAKLMVSATAKEADGDKATTTLPLTIAKGGGAKVARRATGTGKTGAVKTVSAKPRAPKPGTASTKLSKDRIVKTGSAKTGSAKAGVAKSSIVATGGGASGFVLQLASFRSAGDASKEVARLEQRFNELLGGAKLEVHQAEANGSDYFRVRTAPFEGWTKAYDLCTELKANQQDCLVFQHGPVADASKLPAGELTPKDPPQVEASKPISLIAATLPTGAAGPTGAEEGANLRVVDFVVARQVVEREPVDVSESFSAADGDAYAYARIANDGEPTELSFVWFHRDAIYAAVEMTIGTSPRWRTWSSAELQPGPWRVQLVGSDGLIIAENSFTVK